MRKVTKRKQGQDHKGKATDVPPSLDIDGSSGS